MPRRVDRAEQDIRDRLTTTLPRIPGLDHRGHLVEPRHQHRPAVIEARSEEHTSELQSLMRISYAVFCLKKKKTPKSHITTPPINTNTTNINTIPSSSL